jgi:hypothetical protein
MNSKHNTITGKPYLEWTDVIDEIRIELNKIRDKTSKLPENIFTYDYPVWNAETKGKEPELIKNKYKVGDLVYVSLETPENKVGEKQKGLFRNGDYRLTKEPHKILRILYYHGAPYYRYIVNGFKGVSYQEAELKPAKGEQHEKFKVQDIIGRKTSKKIVYYQVWFKGFPKANAIWTKETDLIEDGLKPYIDRFNAEEKERKKKAKKAVLVI